MRVRHIAALAIFCGALGALEGQTAQAAPLNPANFARLLLSRESKQIFTERVTIATQNREVRSLNLLETKPTTPRLAKQIAALEKMILALQAKINKQTSRLDSLNTQATQVIAGIANPGKLVNILASNTSIVAEFKARPPFGIPPVSASS
jgi:hypothetical protein